MKTTLNLFLSANEYYLELYKNFQLAQRSIFILGWDVHSSVDLLPEGRSDRDVAPSQLHLLLKWVANKNKDLKIYILPWEYAFFYTFERDLFLEAKFKWIAPSNIKFSTDGTNPIGASHHQKIVLIDDTIAYCGGIDLTVHRWDNKEHIPNNPKRVLLDGSMYPPYHDLQLRIQGDLVKDFSKIVRSRYRNATGNHIPISNTKNEQLIKVKGSISLEAQNARVLQTRPTGTYGKELREVEQAYLDLIRNAKSFLYIENQYLTSDLITEELIKRLSEDTCPEIMIVLPKMAGAWLELETMGRLQAEKCLRISSADKYKRLQILYPDDSRLKENDYIVVHSKLMLADHSRLVIGSANLTNRSLGLDTECSVYVEGHYQNLFFNLISMFSDVSTEDISQMFENGHSYKTIVSAINSKSSFKKLKDINVFSYRPTIPDDLIPDKDYLDQSQPVEFDQQLQLYNKAIKKRWKILQRLTQNWGFAVTLFGGLFLVLLWNYYPLSSLLGKDQALYQSLLYSPYAILIICGIFFVAGIFFIPINLLILLTAPLYKPHHAFLLIMLGTQFFCFSTYLMGRIVFYLQKTQATYGSHKIVKAFKDNSLLTFIFIRILPIAPSTVIGMIAGYLKASFLQYQIGSAIGIIPGTVALIFFQKSLFAIFQDYSWQNVLVFLFVLLFFAGTYKLARTRFTGYL